MIKLIDQFEINGINIVTVQGEHFIKTGAYLVDNNNHKVKVLGSNFPSIENYKKKRLMLRVDGHVSGNELIVD